VAPPGISRRDPFGGTSPPTSRLRRIEFTGIFSTLFIADIQQVTEVGDQKLTGNILAEAKC